jgi:hypothetical protein
MQENILTGSECQHVTLWLLLIHDYTSGLTPGHVSRLNRFGRAGVTAVPVVSSDREAEELCHLGSRELRAATCCSRQSV